MENETPEPMPKAVKWALGLTAAWAAVLLVLFFSAQSCQPLLPFYRFGERFLSCRPPNEIGDFLAGAFAPVAFLWLIVAVLVQAEELKAQRRELRLTRREFELSRDVAREQRDAMQAQGQAATAQAELAQRASDLAQRESKDRETDQYLATFVRTCRRGNLSRLHFMRISNSQFGVFEIAPDAHLGMEEAIYQIRDHMTNLLVGGAIEPHANPDASTWVYRLRQIQVESSQMTPAQQKKIEGLPLAPIANMLSRWVE